jgi:hypothetical protein
MGLKEDSKLQACSIDEIDRDAEWLMMPAECSASISVRIKLKQRIENADNSIR